MTPGYSKYNSGLGWCKTIAPIDMVKPEFRDTLASILEASFARNSWKQFSSICKKIKSLESLFNIDLSFPWSISSTMNFILACGEQNLQVSSIKVYLSKVKSVHMMLNVSWPESYWIQLILRGMANSKNQKKKPRRAATVDVMRQLKERLISSSYSLQQKRLFWLAVSLMFSGCLRGSEVLCSSESKFSPLETLLNEDVNLSTVFVNGKSHRVLTLNLKNTKEVKGPGVTVIELFETGNFYCPVAAYRKFILDVGLADSKQPLLQLKGKGLTTEALNRALKTLLSGVVDSITTHSFRAGFVTSLVRAGASDEIIQAAGRWSSEAYRLYMKQNKINRIRDMQSMSEKLSVLAKSWKPGAILIRE